MPHPKPAPPARPRANPTGAALLIVALTATVACARTTPNLPVKLTPAQATLRIAIEEGALTLGDENRLESMLRKDSLDARGALPVANGESDLSLNITLGGVGKFTEARWSLVESRSGVVLLDNNVTFVFELDPERTLADLVVADVMTVDLDRYASSPATSGSGPAVVTTTPTNTTNPASGTRGDDAWVVIIGIENYREKLAPATHAEEDARAFEAFVRDTLGVPQERIKLLVGDRAGRGDIASALEEWLPRNATPQPDGPVYIFFSGHGAPDPTTGDAYLVPYDADPAYIKTRGYALKTLYDDLAALPNREVLVFLDACFSGSGDRSVIATGTRPLVPVHVERPQKTVITFAASEASQTTGAARGNTPHGLFTFYLLQGLRGQADANHDADVSLEELSRYVIPQVQRDARLDNREQTPTLTVPAGVDPGAVKLVEKIKP